MADVDVYATDRTPGPHARRFPADLFRHEHAINVIRPSTRFELPGVGLVEVDSVALVARGEYRLKWRRVARDRAELTPQTGVETMHFDDVLRVLQ